MSDALTYVATVALLSITALSACSTDSAGAPGAEAGSAGQAQGGSSAQAGTANGGTRPGGGACNGCRAGAASGGSADGGGGSNAGPGGDAGANQGGMDGEGDVIANCLNAPVMPDTESQALRFTGVGVELGIVRYAPIDTGTSKAIPYELQRFALVRGDVAKCVSAAPDLHYTPSHHNWDDQATATVGSETWLLTMNPGPAGIVSTVEGRTGDAVTWGPLQLALASCVRLDSPQTACGAK